MDSRSLQRDASDMNELAGHMESQGTLKTVWNHSGAWTMDLHLQQIWLSEGLQQLFATNGNISVEAFVSLSHPDDRKALRKQFVELTNGKNLQTVFRLISAKQAVKYIYLKAEPVNINDNRTLAAGLASDIKSELLAPGKKGPANAEEIQTLHHATIETLIINNKTVEVLWSEGLFGMLGFSNTDFTPTREHLFALLHPEDVELLHEEEGKAVEIRLKTKADGYKWFLVSSKKITEVESLVSRMVYVFTDINYLKQVECSLRKNNHDLSRVLHSSSSFMALLDEQLDVIFYNDRLNDAFLPVRRKVPFTQWSKYFIDTDTSLVARRLRVVFSRNIIRHNYMETGLHTADRSAKVIVWHISSISYLGKKAIVCNGIDITESRHTFNRLTDQNKQLREFAHMASHNLRGPVVNTLSLIDLYKRSEKAEDKYLYMDKIELVTKKLLSTIDEFSAILKSSGKGVQPEEIAFDSVLTDTINLFSEAIAETQAIIHSDFTACPSVVYRKVIIDSIFQNLVSNSIKYRNILTTPSIHIQSYDVGGKCVLTFRDNGSGFDMQKNGDKIFGLYNTFHENQDARGVGLYLIKSQVEELGGQVLLESEPEKGSLFTIML